MAERFDLHNQQRRQLNGEAPDSMANVLMRSLLGDKPQQQGLEPYQGVHRTHDHVNELQVGRSLGHHVLADLVQANVSISTLLPFQDVDPSISYFEWTIERFKPGIAPIVPEEAPFSELTYAVEPRYTKLQRRGAAVRMTANIMNTPEGMARLQSQILKLGATVLLTIEHLMVQTLVTAHDGPMFRRKMTLDKYGDREIVDQLNYDAARFAAWNRDPRVEAAADMSQVAKLLGEFTPGPYAVLYPTGRQAVLGGTVLEKPQGMTVITMDGSKNVLQLESPQSSMRMADGSLAFPVPDYSFGRGSRRMQPLLRSTMIGEHYPMTGVRCDDLAWRTGVQLSGGGFGTCQRDILVYDTEQDQYEKVSFEHAFKSANFVPQFDTESDILDDLLQPGNLRARDFTSRDGSKRRAPSRAFWENGPQKVTHFAQFDQEIIPAHIHRRVGNTIAAAVHASEGDISGALASGFQLLRELASAPFSAAFAQSLLEALPGAGITTYREAAPDLVNYYPGIADIEVVAQGPTGTPNVANPQAVIDAINRAGTPPMMLSLSGLRLLAEISVIDGATGRALELGSRARDLLDATEKIYAVLKDKFPDAIAFDPRFRPLNYLPADGFATFFTSVFLNSGNLPIIFTSTVGGEQFVDVVAPFVYTRSIQGAATALPNYSVGTTTNPLEPGGGDAPLFATASLDGAAAHTKTPWAAQHAPFAAAQAQEGLRGTGRRRRPSGTATAAVDDEEDLFGIQPGFRAQQTAVAGLPIDGVGSRDIHRGPAVPGAAFSPMAVTNAEGAWDAADRIDEPLVRVCTMAYLTAPCGTAGDFQRMMDANILVPFDVLLVRPALELDMYSVIVLKPGLDTGFHAVADTVLDFGKDVDHQTRKITFSIRHATVLKAPDHVAILPSRMARRYVTGGSVKLYTSPSQLGLPGDQRPDLIPFVVPMDHKVHRTEPAGGLDVDKRWGPAGSSRYPDAEMYERIWNLSEQAMQTRAHGQRYYDASSVIPSYTWRGEFLNYDRTVRYPAQGHRQGGSHPGCRNVWDSNQPIFPEPPATDQA